MAPLTHVPRADFREWVLSKEGCPYIWGGKGFAQWTRTGLIAHGMAGPDGLPLEVFDCSGLITAGLHALNWWDRRATWGAHDLATLLPRVTPAQIAAAPVPELTLACYGPTQDRISHVMLMVDVDGERRAYGACGGNSDTLAPKKGAAVQFRDKPGYRHDLRWWVHLPLSS